MDSTKTQEPVARVRVFVSYAHDPPAHQREVLRFCSLLWRLGVDVRVDEWDTDLRRDWFLWMIDQLRLRRLRHRGRVAAVPCRG